jgi:lysophospholipase L1-like esterase
MRPAHWIGLTAVFVVVALASTLLFFGLFENGREVRPRPERPGPRTLVSLGDSTISGEGAGAYARGTDGLRGNWCHRSARAEINDVSLPGLRKRINLACSGAAAEQVGFGRAAQYTEGSQAARLARIARRNNVVAVLVGVGANNQPQFGRTVNACFQQWLSRGPGCTTGLDGAWRARVAAMVPKVVRALGDVRTAMRSAGYRDREYQIVLQSYAAPLGPGVPANLQGLAGCPFQDRDLRWFASTGVSALSSGLRSAASQAGVRFLDLSRAGLGHEACVGGANPSKEWFTRLSVRWNDLGNEARAPHALQESFHPNARGYAQFGRCLQRFLARDDRAAACLPGSDGSLNPATSPESR